MPTASLARHTPHLGPRSYRADIDGLRGLAVTAVVLFHAGVTGVSGGFAGVDIFFVISGFLIGGIVHREIGAERFGFAAFYARRARRILPALIAVTLTTLALGMALLGPGELARFAVSGVAALFGASNVWFWHSIDYFAPDARYEPLLMTWSLGIEEQFYLILPPVLLLCRRLSTRTMLGVALGVSALSLLVSIVATPRLPVESFYLLPTRAWELGLGVALALAREAGWRLPDRWRDPLAAIALTALALAIALFDERTRFPGYAALLPTLATAALIATPGSTINRRLLGSRPFVAVGLISYSWYLWHWPLLALLRICAAAPVPAWALVAVGLGSIAPGYCSWRWIERPFRHRAAASNRATLARYAAALGVGVAVLAGVAWSGGVPSRVGATGARVAAQLHQSNDGCLVGYGVAAPNFSPACAPTDARPMVALLGDSHAGALGQALRAAAQRHGYGLQQLTAASCPPLLGATLTLSEHPGASAACAAYNAAAIGRVAHDPRVKTVVLTAFWQSQFSAHARAIGDRVIDVDPAHADRPTATELPIALTRTLRHLRAAGKQVVLLGDVPWIRFDPARHVWAQYVPLRAAIERRVIPGLDSRDGRVARRLVEPLADEGAAIVAASAAAVPGVRLIDQRRLLCDAQACRVGEGGAPFFLDQQHLSRAGADVVVTGMTPTLWP